MGGADINKAALFACCLGMLFLHGILPLPEYSGEQIGAQGSAVCSVTPLKLH